MAQHKLNVGHVAVIGAGVSGVSAGIHLKRAGLEVTVYERTSRAGGIWVFDKRTSKDAAYPSILPSSGESPEYEDIERYIQATCGTGKSSTEFRLDEIQGRSPADVAVAFAPPGSATSLRINRALTAMRPCYVSLKNNVSTVEMEMTCQRWKEQTQEFVAHDVLADYIQDSAIANGIKDSIHFNTRVNRVSKKGNFWELNISELVGSDDGPKIVNTTQAFDSLVVASGHYHACNVPDISGLAEWKKLFPTSIQHSKLYRSSEQFKDKNVLLIGAGVSSTDIARDLSGVARAVFQSSRGGPYDLPSHLLPPNAARIGAIERFEPLSDHGLLPDGSVPAAVTLKSGQKICGLHHVIVCTGYHVSLPFLRPYHADGVRAEDADDTVLVTNGQQVHNLHKDIFYIPDPTLAFIGVPYHVATFSLFEFQAIALAAVLSGRVPLPSQELMRQEYRERVQQKGAGRTFHSLKSAGAELAYVDDLVDMVNGSSLGSTVPMVGHSSKFREAYARRRTRQEVMFSAVRDPWLDRQVVDLIHGC